MVLVGSRPRRRSALWTLMRPLGGRALIRANGLTVPVPALGRLRHLDDTVVRYSVHPRWLGRCVRGIGRPRRQRRKACVLRGDAFGHGQENQRDGLRIPPGSRPHSRIIQLAAKRSGEHRIHPIGLRLTCHTLDIYRFPQTRKSLIFTRPTASACNRLNSCAACRLLTFEGFGKLAELDP
jgi:hypothetical protein